MTDRAQSPVPNAKRNFFKTPAWLEASVKANVKPVTNQRRDPTELFSRSTSTASEVAAEQKRQVQQREKRKEKAAEKEIEASVVKRRKIEGEDRYSDTLDDNKETIPSFKSSIRASASSLQALARPCEETTPVPKKPATIHISDDSDADPDGPALTEVQHPIITARSPEKAPAAPTPVVAALSDEDNDEDEDFPEIARKARRRAREQAWEKARVEAQAKQRHGSDTTPKASEGPNPVIDIMVISSLEGANPILVKRKWSQNFRDIRTAWLNMQHALPSTVKSEVYFTWRGKKVYDVASCRSLGIKLDEYGNPLFPSQSTFSDGSERVVLEATTDAQIKAEREAETERKRKEEEEVEANHDLQHVAPKQPVVDQIRFILKARNMPDQKLKAKSDTSIERIIDSFRIFHKLDELTPVSVLLDGDELSPQDTIQDAGVEDMDMLECHVK